MFSKFLVLGSVASLVSWLVGQKYFQIFTQLLLNNRLNTGLFDVHLEMKIEAEIYFQISDQVYVVPRTPCLLSLDSNVSQAFDTSVDN